MNLNQYTLDAIRTESIIPTITLNKSNLVAILNVYIAAGNLLDDIKKLVFYNKPINNEKWNINKNNISTFANNILDETNENSPFNIEQTNIPDLDPRLFHAIVGIATESTELIEAMLTSINTNSNIDITNIREELGDLNWYQAILINSTNSDWEDILNKNIEKLRFRYPNKFNNTNAINRDLISERSILEN